jgi:hypothetical protein
MQYAVRAIGINASGDRPVLAAKSASLLPPTRLCKLTSHPHCGAVKRCYSTEPRCTTRIFVIVVIRIVDNRHGMISPASHCAYLRYGSSTSGPYCRRWARSLTPTTTRCARASSLRSNASCSNVVKFEHSPRRVCRPLIPRNSQGLRAPMCGRSCPSPRTPPPPGEKRCSPRAHRSRSRPA